MKKIFYVLTLCVVALTSCQGYLDRYSSTALSDNDQLVTSVSDVKRLLNSVGLAFTTTRMAYASEFGLYADITTNEFKIIRSNGQTVQISEYNRGASDQFPGYAFTAWYTAMARANKTLEA
ncbi:MAG: hypothetical protein HUJ90_00950, partial [Bacteroidales bacterium]|nr:hypothetical protein [Bacteroidales bacterium]